MDDVLFLDATAQAELVRRREVKPIELVEASIRRIEAINPAINAIVRPLFDRARDEAEGPLPEGPFSGVPFVLKDLGAALSGVPLAGGCRFLKDFVPAQSSFLVERYKHAGLVVVGKANTPELGILPTTEPRLWGATRNPWKLTASAGGSSGGSAAAVAAAMVPAAHGNDGGGSIRIPASCCGVFGLKPTRGRITLGPDRGDVLHGFVNEHMLTRSVRDSAALLDATCGPEPGDPYFAPAPCRPFLAEVGQDPGRLRIAWTIRPITGGRVHADCVRAVSETARLLEDLGHWVEEVNLEIPGQETVMQQFLTLWAGGQVASIDGAASLLGRRPAPEEFEPLTWALYQLGQMQSLSHYLTTLGALQGHARALATRMVVHDVWLTPTLAEPPAPLGTFDPAPGDPLGGLWRAAAYTPFTPLGNLTGFPAMSVPLHWNNEGLPIGSHFIGRYGDEATLFRLAAQLEQARPWAHRRPEIHSATP